MNQDNENDPQRAVAALRALHSAVDQRVAGLSRRHGERLHCRRGCASCCQDDLRVFDVEAERIRVGNAALLRDGSPHPPGACAFLDRAANCRVYADRPYVCRTQGLPLCWHEEAANGEVVERRDICPENLDGPPLESLDEADCWPIGPSEQRLAAIAERFARSQPVRTTLRSLFEGEPGQGASRGAPKRRP